MILYPAQPPQPPLAIPPLGGVPSPPASSSTRLCQAELRAAAAAAEGAAAAAAEGAAAVKDLDEEEEDEQEEAAYEAANSEANGGPWRAPRCLVLESPRAPPPHSQLRPAVSFPRVSPHAPLCPRGVRG